MTKSKGEVLRSLGGGQVQITTYQQDWETRQIGEGAAGGLAVGMSLFALTAVDFRETKPGSDLWEFKRVETDPTNPDKTIELRVFLHGEDIFMVAAVSAFSGLGR